MSALAAANHRLLTQATILRESLPMLICDAELCAQCEDMMEILLDTRTLTSADYDPLEQIASRYQDCDALQTR